MAKASTRFRNRKINFKTRITIRTGSNALDFEEDGFDGEVEFEEDKKATGSGVETGVDKEEEHELHLQAVLASSSASVSRTSHSGRGSGGAASSSKPLPKAFIPTPDSTGTIDAALFRQLYPPNAWTDPVTYVRFSDTVEDSTTGAILYTMDEEDEDWLEAYNASLGADGRPPAALETVTNGSPGGRSARKGKGEKGKAPDDKGKDVATGPISDDDFELVMECFEKTTDEKAPMAHVNPASLPSFEDMEPSFVDAPLAPLKGFARAIYSHWKERRLKRGGKDIIPQLDYDESNENNPYVCFRRRELKTSRKTRRSDAQNVERLIRLRNDLHAAHALMVKTRDRERLKLESIEMERKIFESRCEVRDLKRRLGEADGDEDILIGRREKRRKKEDAPQSNGMRISIRQPNSIFSPSSLITSVDDLKARKDRAAAIASRIDAGLLKKKEADQYWEDQTDGAYMVRPPPLPVRGWRAVETVPGSALLNGPNGKCEAIAFMPTLQPAIGHVLPSFRRRVGRGGRVMLDRLNPGRARSRPRALPQPQSDVSDEEEEDTLASARRAERFRYDQDASIDFPAVDEPTIIDDFDLPYLIKRASLPRANDLDFLTPDTSYLEQAYAWVSQEPERPPPPLVYGRMPPRPPVTVQTAGPGGVPMPPTQASFQQLQMQAAASQAHRVAQQAAQQAVQQARQAAASQQGQSGGGPDALRKPPSTNGSPVAQGQALPMQIPMPIPIPMQNGAPVQGQWLNGTPITSKPDGSLNLPAGYPQHLQHPSHHLLQQQRLVAAVPNGANGQPATSRLSAPPFSNSSPLQVPLQSPHHQHPPLPLSSPLPPGMANAHLQRPPSANGDHRQSSQVPSRPTSAASSHTSPNIASQGLPLSPGGIHANGSGKRQMQYPIQAGSPGQFAASLKQAGMHQQLAYNGFVGAQT